VNSTVKNSLGRLYGQSLALLTDLYQLTMACGYWKSGRAEQRACFHLSFRSNPFEGGYALIAGLEQAIDLIELVRFTDEDLAYLATLRGNDGQELLPADFLAYLRQLRFAVDVDAMPEGTVVFAHEPLLRVTGPILQCQLLETALLTLMNFQTLIATKASRVCYAAGGDAVIEFGLRRAQGIDGALSAARAAYIGGCSGTSNVLAGRLDGIPVGGTHAHSWVMAFDSEQQAFEAYADAMPNNCIFLVDTYNTLEGVRRAAEIGQRLRRQGYRMIGIRLDSGDLAYLSIEARKILDAAGLSDAVIVASNELDEHLIASLKQQGARINVWGVGTRLVTAYDQPALGGIYKLSAIQRDGRWQRCIKVSEQSAKTTIPGILQVRRFSDTRGFVGDMIYDQELGAPGDGGRRTSESRARVIVDPRDPLRRKLLGEDLAWEDLLIPVMRAGEAVGERPALASIRRRAAEQLAHLHPGIRRFEHPHAYPAGLEESLHELRTQLAQQEQESG
jgi:nicotinate phosphoribosyltransferase